MTSHTYRFALTGYITVDDETVRSTYIGGGLGPLPDGSLATAEETLASDLGSLHAAGTLSTVELLQSYLVTGYLYPYHQVLINTLQRDMPGSGVAFKGIDVEAVPIEE